jgi:DNA polymerase-1
MLERLREVKTTLDEVDLRAGPAADRKERSRRSRILKKALKSMDKGSAKRIWYAIHENVEQARMSRELATLHEEVPVELEIEQLCYRGPEPKRAHTLFESLGFGRLSREFADEAASAAEAGEDRTTAPGASESEFSEEVRYEAVLDAERLDEIVDALRRAGRFAVDTETDHVDPLRARLVGISLAWEEGKGVYVPLGHDYDGAPEQLALAEVQKRLGPLLADPEFPKFAQNLIYDAHVLGRHGLTVVGWDLDTMVAAFLLDSGRSSYSMDSLAEEYLGYTTIKYSEVAGKAPSRSR